MDGRGSRSGRSQSSTPRGDAKVKTGTRTRHQQQQQEQKTIAYARRATSARAQRGVSQATSEQVAYSNEGEDVTNEKPTRRSKRAAPEIAEEGSQERPSKRRNTRSETSVAVEESGQFAGAVSTQDAPSLRPRRPRSEIGSACSSPAANSVARREQPTPKSGGQSPVRTSPRRTASAPSDEEEPKPKRQKTVKEDRPAAQAKKSRGGRKAMSGKEDNRSKKMEESEDDEFQDAAEHHADDDGEGEGDVEGDGMAHSGHGDDDDEGSHDGNDEDEDDGEEDEGEDGTARLTADSQDSATAALQGLLRRLGAGIEMHMGGHAHAIAGGSGRLRALLQGLKSPSEDEKLVAVSELCELLSMSTEDNLPGFPIDQFVQPLVEMLRLEHNPELMLLAARAMTHLIEALPGSVGPVVNNGGVGLLCEKLLNIEYIDLAEQSLTALEKISKEHGGTILAAGGLSAVLQFLDFFSTSLQRCAVTIASNACRSAPRDSFHLVRDSIPLLANLLTYQDKKVVERACLCFARLVDSFAEDGAHVEAIASQGMIENMLKLISAQPMPVSAGTFTMIVRTLSAASRARPSLVASLHEFHVAGTIRQILLGPDRAPGDVSYASGSHTAEQLYEILCLSAEMLPRLPEEGILAGPPSSQGQQRTGRHRRNLTGESMGTPADTVSAADDPRAALIQKKPDVVATFAEELLPVFLEVYQSTVSSTVRRKCLVTILKIVHFSSAEHLTELLRTVAISSFVAGLLTARDPHVVVYAVQLADILIRKMPSIFSTYFRREGVMYEMARLAQAAKGAAAPAPTAQLARLAQGTFSTPPNRRLSESYKKSDKKKGKGAAEEEEGKADAKAGAPRVSAEMANPTPTKSPGAASEETQRWISEQASAFCAEFYHEMASDSAPAHPAAETLRLLKTLAAKISSETDAATDTLVAIRDIVVDAERNVSSFELHNSGMLAALLRYVAVPEGQYSNAARTDRLRCFAHVFLNAPAPAGVQPVPFLPGAPALVQLVAKTHGSLNNIEQFPVILSEVNNRSGAAAGGQRGALGGLKALTQPLKLRLARESGEEGLKDYSGSIVLIEPLATVQAIEDFLWPRVRSRETADAAKTREEALRRRMQRVRRDSAGREFEEEGDDSDSSDVSQSSDRPPESERRQSGTETGAARNRERRLHLYLEGNELQPSMTIFQAVQRFGADAAPEEEGGDDEQQQQRARPLGTYTIKYRLAPAGGSSASNTQGATVVGAATTVGDTSAAAGTAAEGPSGALSNTLALDAYLGALPCSIPPTDAVYPVLRLLRALYGLNRFWSVLYDAPTVAGASAVSLNAVEFVNNRLTAKTMRQLQDPIALCSNSIPEWVGELVRVCPFLFPFDCRQLYFYMTSFGISRALMRLQERPNEAAPGDEGNANGGNERDSFRVGRISRTKVRIPRQRILETTVKVMEMYASTKAILEIEYFDEAGTGLGPTLEFYTLASKAFRRADLWLWRGSKAAESGESTTRVEMDTDGKEVAYVHAPRGLFPAPLPPNVEESAIKTRMSHFTVLGRFVAKALLDCRIIDVPLSLPFCKWMLGLEAELQVRDIRDIDPVLATSLEELFEAARQRSAVLANTSLTDAEREIALDNINIRGASVEDLCLDFTLPGYPEIDLKENGRDFAVTLDNLEEYLGLVVEVTLRSGVRRQFEAFRTGFNAVFPIKALRAFVPEEIDTLLCGSTKELWDRKTLVEACKPDHGYTIGSGAVQKLFDILSEYSPEEQRKFLQFATGSPNLPVGGLRSLNPPLTIVRKTPEAPHTADDYLPSVMTCVNYLKLPDYSTKEVMAAKLKTAINEGQNSFHLS